MYKSRLQELCHQKRWGLPCYVCMKDGPDHNPRFKASVSVNGITFDTPNICKSSREARNEAAKLAFILLASDYNSTAGEPKNEETCQSPESHSNALSGKVDMQNEYKMKLQTYAQRKKLDSPLYSSKKKGPSHAPCFKATVTIDGEAYESPLFYKTLKEAEHAAAKNDFQVWKNLLQQLTQNEDFLLPTYKTIRSGEPHKPTFFSTVEIEGEIFHGNAAKSKKQAELNAAKVAYTTFMKRRYCKSGEFTSSDSSGAESLKSASSLDLPTTTDPQQNLNPGISLVAEHKDHNKETEDEEQGVVSAENVSSNVNFSSQESISSLSSQDINEITEKRNSNSSLDSLPFSPKEGQSSSATMTPPGLSGLSIADSNMETTTEGKSYLLCNKVRVYTCIPDLAFPKGTVLLPIAEDRWVPVSLEFPNEKGT
ncbi:unnamed protein product [Ilex paraguariensis]|uniref:DRBM domain-containing protein n=1 Tax=Ilex paraguariensis TaxID=185542 RepID=A0ABC8UV83_9AQUA